MLIIRIVKYFCSQAWRTIWTAWCNWQDGRGELDYSNSSDSFCTESSKVCHLIIPRPSELGNGGRDREPDHEERHGQRGHRWRDDQDPQLLPRGNNRGGNHKYFFFPEIELALFLQGCKHKYFSFPEIEPALFLQGCKHKHFLFSEIEFNLFLADPLHGEARCEL